MAENRSGQRNDVFVAHVIAVVRQCTRLCRKHQELRGTHASTVVHVFLDDRRGTLGLETRRPHDLHGIAGDRLRHRHAPHQILKVQQLRGVGDGSDFGRIRSGRAVDDPHLIVRAQVVEHRVEQKAIQLRLGKRIGALQLDGILSRQHEERLGQRIHVAAHGAGALLHGLQ